MNRETYIRGKLDAIFQYWFVRASAWGAALFLMLSGLDYVSAPQHFGLFLKYRLISSSLLLLISFAGTRTANRSVHYALAYAGVAASAATIELMILRFGGHTSPYYLGMILLAVSVLGFIPARIYFHAISAALIYFIYLLPIVAVEQITNFQAFFTANAFMSMILLTALLMRYMNSETVIKELGLQYDLEQANEHLEDAVRDRTNELSQAVLRLQQEIVEHEGAEKQLQRSSGELRERNTELRSFMYSISHDLRSPLVNIKGFSGELGKSLKDVHSLIHKSALHLVPGEEARLQDILQNEIPAALGFICASSDKIDALINAFLKLSRISHQELVFETIDMETLVHTLVRSFEERTREQGVTVNIGSLPQTKADRTVLQQVVVGLLDNALKYLAPGRRGIVEITGEGAPSETIYHVRDNGRGIAADDIPRVFEIFKRIGKQDTPGEGMGLAYVKALVKRHGGRIWCESEPGSGTTFSFAIPVGPILAD